MSKYLKKSPPEMIDTVMRRGSVDLGGNCKIIKCPSANKPGACVLCPSPQQSGEDYICSGPTLQEDKVSVLSSIASGSVEKKRTYVPNWPFPSCPYGIIGGENAWNDSRRDETLSKAINTVYPVLKRHPDYDEYDWRKNEPEHLERIGEL